MRKHLVTLQNLDDPRKLSRLVFYILGIIAAYAALHGGGFHDLPRWVVSFTATSLFLLLLTNKNRVIYLPKGPLVAAWGTLIIWMCLSAIFSVNPNAAIGFMLLIAGLLLAGLLAFALANTEAETNKFVAILLVGASASTIFGWVIYILGRFTVQGGHEMVRHFIGPFFWKNPMGGYLILFIPLALVSAMIYKRLWAWLAAILSTLMISGLILTRSRGSWIAIAITILFVFLPSLLIKRIKKEKWLVLLAIMICSFLIGFALAPPSAIEERAKSIATVTSPDVEGQSTTERIAMWKAGIEVIKDYPIFGVGPDCWPYIRAPYLTELRFIPKYPHNIYLRTAAEQGVPGLIILLFAICLTYFPLMLSSYKKKINLLVTGIATGLGASFLHMVVDFDAAFAGILLPIALLAGLGHRIRVRGQIGLPRLRYGRRVVIAVVMIFGLILVARGVSSIKLGEGRDYIEIMEYERATKPLKTSIITNPISWEARYDYSRTLFQLGRLETALEELEIAIGLAPTVPEIQRSMGMMQEIAGDTNSAVNYYRNSIALSPRSSSQNYFELADLYREMSELRKAARVLLSMTGALAPFAGEKYTSQTASFRYQLAEAWRELAEIFMDMGDTTGVAIAVEKATKYSELRKKDYPLAMMGIDTPPPEMVVKNFFQALNEQDTSALKTSVLDTSGPLPRVSEGIKLEFGRVLQIQEDPIQGRATVEFVMERTDSVRTVNVPSSLDLVLHDGRWKVIFAQSN